LNLDLSVAIFFAISGFLLYRPYVNAQLHGHGGPGALRFYRRRFWRIVPAYWVALTVLSLFPGDHATFSDWPKYYLFLQVYSPPVPSEGLFQAWSLAVEVAFYLLLPLLALLVGRAFSKLGPRRRVQAELVLLAALSLASALCEYVVIEGNASPLLQGVPRYFFWFAVGMAMAVLSAGRGAVTVPGTAYLARRPGSAWAAALVVFVVLGFITGQPADGSSFGTGRELTKWVAGGILGMLILAPAVLRAPAVRSTPSRVLSTRLAMWLGLISYGIFLWQMGPITWLEDERDTSLAAIQAPILRFAIYSVISLAVTIPLAAASYYLLEKPLLRFKDPRQPKPGRPDHVASR
jgi:peptidoglycan/LPS O-acetylase OafA/YrhL